MAVTGSQTPSFLPSPQQGHVCQTPRASLGWQTMCLCPRAPPPHPLQISPVQAGRPRPGCQYPGLPGLGVEDAWWTHLHPRVPGRVSYFLETKMYKEVRGGNKRGRRSEPQGREAREPFSPPRHKRTARGDTSEPQAAEFPHKAVGIPGDPEVSLGGCPWPCSHISSQLRCAEGSQGQGFNFANGSSENCASQLPAASHVSKTEP